MLLLRWLVETGHEHVQVGRQGVHDDDFAGRGTDNVGGLLGAVLGHVLPADERRVAHAIEVAVHTNGTPCLQLCLEVSSYCLWLAS